MKTRIKTNTLALLLITTLTSCQRGCNKLDRAIQTTDRYYEVTLFSGGDTVFTDKFKGIVNNSEQSDGIYYFNNNGQMIEISGDYIIKSSK